VLTRDNQRRWHRMQRRGLPGSVWVRLCLVLAWTRFVHRQVHWSGYLLSRG